MPLSGRRSRLALAIAAGSALLFAALLTRHAGVHAQSPGQNQLSVYSPQTSYSVPLLDVNGQPYAGLVELLEPLGSVDARIDGKKYKLHFTPPGGRPLEVQFTDGKDKGKVRGNGLQAAGKFRDSEWPGLCPLVRYERSDLEAARQRYSNYTRPHAVCSSAMFRCTTPWNCTRTTPRGCCWASPPR